jgi:hypothetical protein
MRGQKKPATVVVRLFPGMPYTFFPDELDFNVVPGATCGNIPR